MESKKRLLIILIAILLANNLVLSTILIKGTFDNSNKKRFDRKEHVNYEQELIDKLNLREQQVFTVKEKMAVDNETKKHYKREMLLIRKLIHKEIKQQHPDLKKIDSLASQSGKMFGKYDSINFRSLVFIKQQLNDNQAKRLDSLLQGAFLNKHSKEHKQSVRTDRRN